jgi:hypothetical protein
MHIRDGPFGQNRAGRPLARVRDSEPGEVGATTSTANENARSGMPRTYCSRNTPKGPPPRQTPGDLSGSCWAGQGRRGRQCETSQKIVIIPRAHLAAPAHPPDVSIPRGRLRGTRNGQLPHRIGRGSFCSIRGSLAFTHLAPPIRLPARLQMPHGRAPPAPSTDGHCAVLSLPCFPRNPPVFPAKGDYPWAVDREGCA